MKILKFGGSSVANAECIERVINIVTSASRDVGSIAVVVSAFAGTTDELIKLGSSAACGGDGYKGALEALKQRHLRACTELIDGSAKILGEIEILFKELDKILHGISLLRECSKRTLDLLMSFGEKLSATILAGALTSRGMWAEALDASTVVQTDENFGNARVNLQQSSLNLVRHFASTQILQIVTGFLGATASGETSTLGRGGSDLTASILGYALNAESIEIWTDVDGMLTCDPRKVPKAFSLPHISFEEAMELCHFGAKVIYPPTLQPARDKGIPVKIRNTFNPGFNGTEISDKVQPSRFSITGISSIPEVTLLRIQGSGMVGVSGTSMRLFGALASNAINVILITQASSEHTICLAVSPNDAPRAKELIEHEFRLEINANLIDPVLVEPNLTIVSVVGDNMRRRPGIAGKLFAALGKNGVNVVAIAQGSSERNISFVTSSGDEKKALNAIHDEFFLSDAKSLNLYLAGPGLIGQTLLTQLAKQHKYLKEKLHIDVRLVGICKSQKMILNEQGLNLEQAGAVLNKDGIPANIELFVQDAVKANLPNSVFVDCTASDEVVTQYCRLLDSSVSIVTPNKKAQSGPLQAFNNLKYAAKRRGAMFLYETSVGAGLPIIGTLQDLLHSGDRIISIEGVFSGTLSYLFNSFDGSKPFSALVRSARELGFTEPDPRDDLSGLDVARKLLILARECGLELELSDVSVQNLVPEDCRTAQSINDFLDLLSRSDPVIETLRVNAAAADKRLRYVGSVRDGQASVALQTLDRTHPFYALSGSDNIIAFATTRYNDRPLVVRGPGAGAEVTAAGVFADIIRAGSR